MLVIKTEKKVHEAEINNDNMKYMLVHLRFVIQSYL